MSESVLEPGYQYLGIKSSTIRPKNFTVFSCSNRYADVGLHIELGNSKFTTDKFPVFGAV